MVLIAEALIADQKAPTILSQVRSQLLMPEARPTINNDSCEHEDEMVSMGELKEALALISRRMRDLR